ncbi:hypothetical protein [Streptomyces sp. NPDC086838]|uniref:DUF7848 domain-containing protein n=1 Tax=Streptomyces sp. NPDC086838 TaxID=3365762 RepID=UPI003801DA2A
MSPRAVIRHADWTIAADQTPGASGPIYELECTTCDAASDTSEEKGGPESWALRHTGSNPDHRGFRATVTMFFRVSPAPGNPYAEEVTA